MQVITVCASVSTLTLQVELVQSVSSPRVRMRKEWVQACWKRKFDTLTCSSTTQSVWGRLGISCNATLMFFYLFMSLVCAQKCTCLHVVEKSEILIFFTTKSTYSRAQLSVSTKVSHMVILLTSHYAMIIPTVIHSIFFAQETHQKKCQKVPKSSFRTPNPFSPSPATRAITSSPYYAHGRWW